MLAITPPTFGGNVEERALAGVGVVEEHLEEQRLLPVGEDEQRGERQLLLQRVGDLVHAQLQVQRTRPVPTMITTMKTSRMMLRSARRLLRSSMRRELLVEGLRLRGDLPAVRAHVVDLALQDGEGHLVEAQRRGCGGGTRVRRTPASARGNPRRRRSWRWGPWTRGPVTWSRMACSASASPYPVCLVRMAAAARPCRSSGLRPLPVADGQAVRLRQEEDLGDVQLARQVVRHAGDVALLLVGVEPVAQLAGQARHFAAWFSRGRERLASTRAEALDRQTFLSSIEVVVPDICEHAVGKEKSHRSALADHAAGSPRRRSGERCS